MRTRCAEKKKPNIGNKKERSLPSSGHSESEGKPR